MDHRRIEWLFFVIFLAISIFLGVELWRTPIQLSGTSSDPNTTTNIGDEIKADNIDLPSLSEDTASGYYLACLLYTSDAADDYS